MVGHLLMLEQNAGLRTNLGMINPTDEDVRVDFRVFADNGTSLGERTITVEANGVIQASRFLRDFSDGDVSGARAEIRCLTEDGSLLVSGSPGLMGSSRLYLENQTGGTVGHDVPAIDVTTNSVLRPDRVGHLLQIDETGASGRTTAIRLLNLGDRNSQVELRFFDPDGVELGVVNRTLLAHGFVHIDRVLRQIGADGASGVRAEVRTTGRVLAVAVSTDRISGDSVLQPAWVEQNVVAD
jgi:hypothetical protein